MIAEPTNVETNRIAQQLESSWKGPAWHGRSLGEILNGVTAEIAAYQPPGGAHSIWQLVRHLAVWTAIARRTIEGEPYPANVPPAQDFPQIEGAWSDAVAELEHEQLALIAAVRNLDDARLSAAVPPHNFTIHTLLYGVVQHNSYHGGQLALLIKLATTS